MSWKQIRTKIATKDSSFDIYDFLGNLPSLVERNTLVELCNTQYYQGSFFEPLAPQPDLTYDGSYKRTEEYRKCFKDILEFDDVEICTDYKKD